MNPSTWNLYGWAFQNSKNPVQKHLYSSVPRFRLQEYLFFFPQPILKNIFTHFTCLFLVAFPNITPVPAFFHWFNCRRETQTWDATPSGLRGETQQNKCQPYETHDLGSFYFLPKSEDVNKRITYITRSEPTFFSSSFKGTSWDLGRKLYFQRCCWVEDHRIRHLELRVTRRSNSTPKAFSAISNHFPCNQKSLVGNYKRHPKNWAGFFFWSLRVQTPL